MIIKLLIGIGLIVIPFALMPGAKGRPLKLAIALGLAFAISLLALYQGKLKRFSNKWALIFIGYLLVSILLAPKLAVKYNSNLDMSNFWVWQPTFHILVFALMIITVYSIDWKKIEIRTMFSAMVWVGFLTSLHMFYQAFHLRQFFVLVCDPALWSWPEQRHITGALGHNTHISPLVAMIIPLAIYMKKYIKAGLMVVAVFLANSQVAYGAMIVSLLFYFGTFNRRQFVAAALVLLIGAGILIGGYNMHPKIKSFVKDSGRFREWKLVLEDVKNPLVKGDPRTYTLTGYSIGSFIYTYPLRHRLHYAYHQAHSDYVELLYNTGFIGLSLFLCAMFYVIKPNLSFVDPARNALLSSFVCIAICAAGTFVWQLGTFVFYTAFIVGLLHKGGKKLWLDFQK